MLKVKINSKQIFENYEDSFSEEHECDIIYLEDGFKILYDNCEVSYDNGKVFVNNNSVFMEIEVDNKNIAKMNTPYGVIDLEVIGEKISFNRNPFCFEIRYAIKFGNTEQYINELQILVLNN